MKHKKSVLKILSANSECFRVSAGIAPNVFGLGEGGGNSTTDELCRNVAKSANAHSNYRQPVFCKYIVSCRFSSSYNLTKHIKK